ARHQRRDRRERKGATDEARNHPLNDLVHILITDLARSRVVRSSGANHNRASTQPRCTSDVMTLAKRTDSNAAARKQPPKPAELQWQARRNTLTGRRVGRECSFSPPHEGAN